VFRAGILGAGWIAADRAISAGERCGNQALVMAGQLTRESPAGSRAEGTALAPAFLLAVAAAGLVLITLYGLRLVSTASLVTLPTTLFLTVYLGSMLAAARVLRGPARVAAIVASLAVLAMLPYCGWTLLAPAAVALLTGWRSAPSALARPDRSRRRYAPDRQHGSAERGQAGDDGQPGELRRLSEEWTCC